VRLLDTEIGRFLLIGSTTVLIDLLIYSAMLWLLNGESASAKGIGFLGGTIFAYFANRSYTFQSSRRGVDGFILFGGLYVATLLLNVFANEGVLNSWGRSELVYVVAFLVATLLSASLNFLGMKYLIFAEKEEVVSR